MLSPGYLRSPARPDQGQPYFSTVISTVCHRFTNDQLFQPQVLTNFQGPGASDDGASCAVMLEVVRVVLASKRVTLTNDLIFLFNGAEEAILPASHGFITKHR